jgi:hypothetical protein
MKLSFVGYNPRRPVESNIVSVKASVLGYAITRNFMQRQMHYKANEYRSVIGGRVRYYYYDYQDPPSPAPSPFDKIKLGLDIPEEYHFIEHYDIKNQYCGRYRKEPCLNDDDSLGDAQFGFCSMFNTCQTIDGSGTCDKKEQDCMATYDFRRNYPGNGPGCVCDKMREEHDQVCGMDISEGGLWADEVWFLPYVHNETGQDGHYWYNTPNDADLPYDENSDKGSIYGSILFESRLYSPLCYVLVDSDSNVIDGVLPHGTYSWSWLTYPSNFKFYPEIGGQNYPDTNFLMKYDLYGNEVIKKVEYSGGTVTVTWYNGETQSHSISSSASEPLKFGIILNSDLAVEDLRKAIGGWVTHTKDTTYDNATYYDRWDKTTGLQRIVDVYAYNSSKSNTGRYVQITYVNGSREYIEVAEDIVVTKLLMDDVYPHAAEGSSDDPYQYFLIADEICKELGIGGVKKCYTLLKTESGSFEYIYYYHYAPVSHSVYMRTTNNVVLKYGADIIEDWDTGYTSGKYHLKIMNMTSREGKLLCGNVRYVDLWPFQFTIHAKEDEDFWKSVANFLLSVVVPVVAVIFLGPANMIAKAFMVAGAFISGVGAYSGNNFLKILGIVLSAIGATINFGANLYGQQTMDAMSNTGIAEEFGMSSESTAANASFKQVMSGFSNISSDTLNLMVGDFGKYAISMAKYAYQAYTAYEMGENVLSEDMQSENMVEDDSFELSYSYDDVASEGYLGMQDEVQYANNVLTSPLFNHVLSYHDEVLAI